MYDPTDNFTSRLKVETNVNGVIKDHREGFAQEQYKRGENGVYQCPEGAGLHTVKRGERKTIKPPRPAKAPVIKPNPKTKTNTDDQDAALKKAAKKDLSNRGL